MARQTKTRQPKAKFARPCLTCGTMPVRKISNGNLVVRYDCGHAGDAPSVGGQS